MPDLLSDGQRSAEQLVRRSDAHLPGWATRRCTDCGELFLPGFGSLWRGGRPSEITHGGLKYCQKQADFLAHTPDALALMATLMHQALIEASETLGRFMAEAEDASWTDETAAAVATSQHSIDRGLEAQKLVAFEIPEVPA